MEYPLPETTTDKRQAKWRYKARNTPKKRLPAIVDRAVKERKEQKGYS